MMNSVAKILELESTTVDLEPGHFERMLRRRDRKRRNQRIRAGALAVIVAVVTVAALARAFNDVDRTADEPHPPTLKGTVITYTGGDPRGWGDLVATDPDTGEVRTIVDAHSIDSEFLNATIYNAAISGDGKWVAFDVATGCGKGGPGLWVTNVVDEPRRLTKPCAESSAHDALGLWEWSPSGGQLLVALGSPTGDALVLIDPRTGDRTDLGKTAGGITSLAWSPDGTQIAYATVPAGSPYDNSPNGSVYVVSVDGGEHSLIAESLGQVPGGEEGVGIAWSPDGTRLAVNADQTINASPWSATLYVMNADGSERRPLAESVVKEHVLGSPNIAWSPDGTRITYATISDERDQFRIWSAAPDGFAPVLIFDAAGRANGLTGGPVWSPDGTRIAFRYDKTEDSKRWLIVNADGSSGDAHEIDQLKPLSWRGGWYFCECYG